MGIVTCLFPSCNDAPKPSLPALVAAVASTQELVRTQKGKKFHFMYVPRDKNAIADWLGRVAYHRRASVARVERWYPELREGDSPPSAVALPTLLGADTPPFTGSALLMLQDRDGGAVGPIWGGAQPRRVTCARCLGEVHPLHLSRVCWGCG